MEGYWAMVDVCGLSDLGYVRRSWTFEKRVAGGSYCRVRLDRALATSDWCTRFPMVYVENLTAAASDHGPILLRWDPRVVQPRRRNDLRLFRYETMWESRSDFSTMMVHTWEQGGAATTFTDLQQKLSVVSSQLQA